MIMKLGGERGLTDAFLSAEMGILALVVSAYGISAAMRLRSEETAGRVEADPGDPDQPGALGRVARDDRAGRARRCCWWRSGCSRASPTARRSRDFGQVGRVLGAALAQLPAVWVLTGITVAVFGLAPGLIMAGWGALVLFLRARPARVGAEPAAVDDGPLAVHALAEAAGRRAVGDTVDHADGDRGRADGWSGCRRSGAATWAEVTPDRTTPVPTWCRRRRSSPGARAR